MESYSIEEKGFIVCMVSKVELSSDNLLDHGLTFFLINSPNRLRLPLLLRLQRYLQPPLPPQCRPRQLRQLRCLHQVRQQPTTLRRRHHQLRQR